MPCFVIGLISFEISSRDLLIRFAHQFFVFTYYPDLVVTIHRMHGEK